LSWAHTDKCWARYASAWCLDRVVQKPGTEKSRTNHDGENKDAWPSGGGGNFVDITLRVVVKQAAGTLLLFQPEYLHGTTRLCGAHNRLCVITFSTHILKAYQIAVEGTKLEAGDGAGEGDTELIYVILIVNLCDFDCDYPCISKYIQTAGEQKRRTKTSSV